MKSIFLNMIVGGNPMTPEQVSAYGELGVHNFEEVSRDDQPQIESQGIGLRRSQRNRSIPGHLANFGNMHVFVH